MATVVRREECDSPALSIFVMGECAGTPCFMGKGETIAYLGAK